MNKLIIIEASDRTGKGALIKGLCKYLDYKNVTIRHCDKPPRIIPQEEILDYQMKAFEQELELVHYIGEMNRKFMYHDNTIIYDRFYLGEYVYGTLFRNNDPKEIKNRILNLEEIYIKSFKWLTPYLILLTADPQFLLNNEDGKSFAQNLEQKTEELKLFEEAYNFSAIKNKVVIKVDKDGIFRRKEDILNDVIQFIQ